MIPNSKDRINCKNCSPKTTHDGRLQFVCNCPSYMSSPMPERCMTWNYFGLKKRKFKGICHLLCQSVSKSQTLLFPACKMPAMPIHGNPDPARAWKLIKSLSGSPQSSASCEPLIHNGRTFLTIDGRLKMG